MTTAYHTTPENEPAPGTEATVERADMVRLAEEWDTVADNLAMAISIGAPRHPSEVDVLRQCTAELRSTLRSPSSRRPEAQSAGGDSTPDVDPLGHVVVGDRIPWPVGSCEGETRTLTPGRR